jgi:hypothetical protein
LQTELGESDDGDVALGVDGEGGLDEGGGSGEVFLPSQKAVGLVDHGEDVFVAVGSNLEEEGEGKDRNGGERREAGGCRGRDKRMCKPEQERGEGEM